MRIIAGVLGGLPFDSPRSFKTHPMSDKVRGALFNALGDIEGLTILDAFAGSGALGFEAVSRGAACAVLIDNDRQAQKVIAENIQSLGLDEQVKLIRASVGAWLQTSPAEAVFDVVLCDPPYNDLQPSLINRLTSKIALDGILVLSWPGSKTPPVLSGVHVLKQRNYGDAQLLMYRRVAPTQ